MHRITVRRSAALLFAAALIAVAAFVVPAAVAGSSSNGPPQTRVYGGGNVPIESCTDGAITFCTHVTREFSIFAVRDPNEQVTYGTITFGNPANGNAFVVRVTCLAVSGNVADVGGVVVRGPAPSDVGASFEIFIRDSGPPGPVLRDGVSPIAFNNPPSNPICKGVSSDVFTAGFFTLAYGDVAIQQVTNQNS